MRSELEGNVVSEFSTTCTNSRMDGLRTDHAAPRPVRDDERACRFISVLQDYRGRGLLAPAQTELLINRIHELSALEWDPTPDPTH
jgi:hypothetical protein